MNQIKNVIPHKFEKPIRKNSEDFDDSDIDIDSDFSFNNDINNDYNIEIDNGKTKEDIIKLKNGLNFQRAEDKINQNINIKKNNNYNDKDSLSDDKNDFYSDKEESEQEDNDSQKGSKDNNNNNKKEELKNEKEESIKDNKSKSEKSIKDIKDDNMNNNEQNNISKEDINQINEEEKHEKIEQNLINSIAHKEIVTRERIQMAESIKFRDEPDQIILTDDYGFIKKNSNSGNKNNKKESSDDVDDEINDKNDSKTPKKLLQINARIEKWNYMIENYKEFSTNKKKKAILKSRTRKGIPDCLRGYVWQLFANKDKYYVKGLYQQLEKEPVKEDLETVIIKDLDRTFPLCQFFREKYGNGQRKLYKVLSAYSKYNKEVGYVQGMGFITAVFLIYMDEESSFYMLHCLMKKYKLEGLYFDGFPDLKKKCYVFLKLQKKYINAIYNLFKKESIMPTMYVSSWFISLFARTFEFHITLRIYDCFFLEGFKVIYRMALALLKLNEPYFFKAKKGEVLPLIYKCYENIDVEELLKVGFGFNISRNFIDKCEEEFEKVKDDPNNEFMASLCW